MIFFVNLFCESCKTYLSSIVVYKNIPDTTPCAKQGLEKPKLNLQGSYRQVRGRMLLKEISQILPTTKNISTIQEEHILTTIRNIVEQHIYDCHGKEKWKTLSSQEIKLIRRLHKFLSIHHWII